MTNAEIGMRFLQHLKAAYESDESLCIELSNAKDENGLRHPGPSPKEMLERLAILHETAAGHYRRQIKAIELFEQTKTD
jgi:hypothetical protein